MIYLIELLSLAAIEAVLVCWMWIVVARQALISAYHRAVYKFIHRNDKP